MKRIFIIAAVLLIFSLALSVQAETVNRIAAVVNGEIITTYQIEKEITSRWSEAKDKKMPVSQIEVLRREILSNLIEEALIRQRIEELGINVSEDEIEAAVQDVQDQNRLTRSQLEEALQLQGMSFDEYRENLRKQILRFKLMGREVQSKIEVTNQEIRDYFREHIDNYREEPYMRISRISFSFPAGSTADQVETIRGKAQEALARLRRGEDFYAVLLSCSADKSAEGGDMGTFAKGELTPAFDRAAENLCENEVSDLVETPEGFHILKVTERSVGKVRHFDAVKDEIRDILMDQKREEGFKSWSQKLRKTAYIDIKL
jgi:peptidyl-prolyl cis-trans isomerase SurA